MRRQVASLRRRDTFTHRRILLPRASVRMGAATPMEVSPPGGGMPLPAAREPLTFGAT